MTWTFIGYICISYFILEFYISEEAGVEENAVDFQTKSNSQSK